MDIYAAVFCGLTFVSAYVFIKSIVLNIKRNTDIVRRAEKNAHAHHLHVTIYICLFIFMVEKNVVTFCMGYWLPFVTSYLPVLLSIHLLIQVFHS